MSPAIFLIARTGSKAGNALLKVIEIRTRGYPVADDIARSDGENVGEPFQKLA